MPARRPASGAAGRRAQMNQGDHRSSTEEGGRAMTDRRRLRRRLIGAGGVLVVGVTAAVFAFTTNGSAAREAGGTLVVNINTGPATIDPRDMTSFFDTIGLNFYVRLMAYGSKPGSAGTQRVDPTNMVPSLAKSFTKNRAASSRRWWWVTNSPGRS